MNRDVFLEGEEQGGSGATNSAADMASGDMILQDELSRTILITNIAVADKVRAAVSKIFLSPAGPLLLHADHGCK